MRHHLSNGKYIVYMYTGQCSIRSPITYDNRVATAPADVAYTCADGSRDLVTDSHIVSELLD